MGVLENHAEGVIEECPTVDALGRPKVPITFDLIRAEAWVELSQASGHTHIEKNRATHSLRLPMERAFKLKMRSKKDVKK